ncbi:MULTISPECIES: hypothetical protein [Acidithrix]|nr:MULTISPECIES: hypothetical protein [Acidithrix]
MTSVICQGLTLKTPVMNASGVGGFSNELHGYVNMAEMGAFVTKSLAPFETKGNPAPRVVGANAAMLNSVGLTGPGIEFWRENLLAKLVKINVPTIVSIWGRTIDDYARAAALLQGVDPIVVGVEVNVSCPNIEDKNKMFAHSVTSVGEILDATKELSLPRLIKLSPSTHLLGEILEVVDASSASGVVLTNTALGLSLDMGNLLPSLGARGGGLSGPALHQIALRAIYDSYRALPNLPIVGVGGVSNARGAIEMLAAGARVIQIGTASFVEPRVISKVIQDLPKEIEKLGFSAVSDLVGAAHRGGAAATRD